LSYGDESRKDWYSNELQQKTSTRSIATLSIILYSSVPFDKDTVTGTESVFSFRLPSQKNRYSHLLAVFCCRCAGQTCPPAVHLNFVSINPYSPLLG